MTSRRKAWICAGLVLATAAGIGADPVPTIETVRDLRSLSPAEAAQNYPVRITGVVTYFEPARSRTFIQDETGGVYVYSGLRWARSGRKGPVTLSPGDHVQLRGVSSQGGFAPSIGRPTDGDIEVTLLGKAPLPAPVRLFPRMLLEPALDSVWSETIGVVRKISLSWRTAALEMTDGLTQFKAVLHGNFDNLNSLRHLEGSRIRVQGVYGVIADELRRQTGVQIFVPSLEYVTVLESGASEVFESRPLSVNELRQFRVDSLERVRVRGVVTAAFPPGRLFLRVEGVPLEVLTDASDLPQPGELIDVAGYPSLLGSVTALHTATWRTVSHGEPPTPQRVPPSALPDPSLQGELVRIEAMLVDQLVQNDECLLLLHDGVRSGSARLALMPGQPLPKLAERSLLQITGICTFRQDAVPVAGAPAAAVSGFNLQLRSAADLTILRTPPFWSARRVIAVASALLLALFSSALWVFLLRRKVRQQTAQIAAQMKSQEVYEERLRIARELHDTLEQDLAGIGLQLDLAVGCFAKNLARTRQTLELALRMLRRTQMEARHSIQDLRDNLMDRRDLTEALHQVIHRFETEHHTAVQADIRPLPTPLPVPVEQNLLRIAREALHNAIRHANAQTVRLAFLPVGQTAELRIEDDGRGFDPTRPTPGHFGLIGMRERAANIGGHLEIRSAPGEGCLIRLTLDLPETTP